MTLTYEIQSEIHVRVFTLLSIVQGTDPNFLSRAKRQAAKLPVRAKKTRRPSAIPADRSLVSPPERYAGRVRRRSRRGGLFRPSGAVLEMFRARVQGEIPEARSRRGVRGNIVDAIGI